MCVADFYGEEWPAVPPHIMTYIRRIIKVLYDNHIMYPDITGYNFIVDDDDEVWIIDFEHCYFEYDDSNQTFVNEFINGIQSWNPDFK